MLLRRTSRRRPGSRRGLLALVPLAALVAGCSSSSAKTTAAAGPPATVRLGYFANVTHAGPVLGVADGYFQAKLGPTRLQTQVFNAGGTAITALLSGAIDAAYVGPSPAVNGFVESHGDALRIVAGATANGASLVVKPSITSPGQLKGTTLADPQLGATQDVALRTWLAGQGFHETAGGGGDVSVVSEDNATTLDQFKAGRVDGGWLPEPWASRLVLDGGAHVLVNEASLWPGGQFVTTNLVVSRTFLAKHPDTVKELIEGQVAADHVIETQPAAAQKTVNAALKTLTGKALKPAVIARAYSQIRITEDPLAASLKESAAHAEAAGLLKKASLSGIYDLRLLRQVLGHDVSDAGLGAS